MNVYLHDWKDGGFNAMVSDFEGIWSWNDDNSKLDEALTKPRWQGVEVLLASYGSENYGGDAFVLFRRDGVLYEVNGGHCSCHGLGSQGYSGDRDTQWEPEATTVESLRHRLGEGNLGTSDYHGNVFANELRSVLDALEDN